MRGLPSASRISAARARRPRASGPAPRSPATSIEIGNAAGAHGAAVGQVDQVAVGLVADPLADQADEVLRAAGQLEADQVGAEQALEDLAPPRQLREQLGRRERDVQEEADPQVGPQLAQHLRHQLQLVVVHPDGRVLGGAASAAVLGEAPVDRDVGVPPLAVELRLGDHVVVERPQRGVGEALVEVLDLLGASAAIGTRRHARRRSNGSGPSSVPPGQPIQAPSLAPHHRLERGDQAAGARRQSTAAVGQRHPVDRQPVGDDHEVGRHPFTLGPEVPAPFRAEAGWDGRGRNPFPGPHSRGYWWGPLRLVLRVSGVGTRGDGLCRHVAQGGHAIESWEPT